MQISNIIVLSYASNNCYTTVVDEIPREIEVDCEAGTWNFVKGHHLHRETAYEIGNARHCSRDSREGVIGVYDRMKTAHLGKMLSDAKGATDSGEGVR